MTRLFAAACMVVGAVLDGLAGAPGRFVVAEGGRPAADVVVPDSPPGMEQIAADELAYHLGKAFGERPAILKEGEIGSSRFARHFFIGATKAAAAAGLTAKPFADDERLVKTAGGNLYLLGGDSPMQAKRADDLMQPAARGTLYAVYDFLESEMGVKWIWPGETGEVVPKRKSLAVGATDRRGREPLEYRFYFGMGSEPVQTRFLMRHRLGKRVNISVNHAFAKYWKRFRGSHPEFFAMRPDGRREPLLHAADWAVALCVSQPGLWRQIVDDWLGSRKAGGRFPPLPWICCCENDSPGLCTCDACRAWDGPDERFARNPYWNGSGKDPLVALGRFGRLSDVRWGESGTRPPTDAPASVSDRYAKFYNHVLAEARKSAPEARVIGYAYANYVEAPKATKVDSGVVIEFVPRSYFPYDRAESNFFRRNWLGWRKAGVRDMTLRPNFTHAFGSFPVDCARTILDDFAFAYTNGMVGCSFDSLMCAWSPAAMSHYALTRAFRDPLRGYEKARADMRSAFGSAAGEIDRYFDFIERFSAWWTDAKFQKVRWANKTAGGVPGGGFNRQEYILGDFYPDKFFPRAYSLLDAAKDAAKGDAEVLSRVEFLRRGILNTELTRATRIAEKAWDADKEDQGKKAAFADAYAKMKAYRASIAGEHVFSEWRANRVEDKMMGWAAKAAAAGFRGGDK
ncbi:MAG: DUF4838 domain-containing protein [Kiritimatiellae bacterium]|nr:DUF4838 domain-containing protein [Kiritimatiellia bacterium]